MARPRVFISSTFYDLRQVRSDIERFIREIGYEPVRHETGAVPYSKDERLEYSAYREIELSDIIVFITGGKYGTESEEHPGYSISQVELKRALDMGIQIFVFVETNVMNEYNTYKLNKQSKDVRYSSVNNIGVFEFLEELYSLPNNNPITHFSVASDITSFLREQFAGLFHRFLQDQKHVKEMQVLEEMNSVAQTLNELVRFLTNERRNKDDAIKSILLTNHPAFRRLAALTKTPYRVFFSNRDELDSWLKARGCEAVRKDSHDADSVDEWNMSKGQLTGYIKFKKKIFGEDGRLIPYSEDDWSDDWIEFIETPPAPPAPPDDDIPF